MNHSLFVFVVVGLGFVGLACVAQAPVSTPTAAPTPSPAPTVDIGATVAAAVEAALAPSTPLPTTDIPATVSAAVEAALSTVNPVPAADIEATIEARVLTKIVTLLAPTSPPIPTPKTPPPPTATPMATLTLMPAPVPKSTPTPTPRATPEPKSPLDPTPAPNPGTLILSPIEVSAGATQQLEAVFEDKQGNLIGGGEVTWAVLDANAGSISPSGLFTAGEAAGRFEGAVHARGVESDLAATTSVTITPGPLDLLGVAPEQVKIGMEMTQQFIAVGADTFGNRVPGLSFTWSINAGGGTIDESGLFTAGTTPGSYGDTVKVTTTQGNQTRSKAATITVEPDRIAFVSNRDAPTGAPDIYIMDVDGTNVERSTNIGVGADPPSWSPDGRRITFNSGGMIIAADDGGAWTITLFSESLRGDDPAWAPDGTKIVFQSFEHSRDNLDDAGSEIYVMEVDGGNRTRLTANSYRDDEPSWSPDGSQIVFIRHIIIHSAEGSDYDLGTQIFVMDIDGSNQRRVTGTGESARPSWSPDGSRLIFQFRIDDNWQIAHLNASTTLGAPILLTLGNTDDRAPAWSPDGQRIAFQSDRDSRFPELYVMDRSGRNITRLTHNEAWDGVPAWAPRKRGVEVSEASVVLPRVSSRREMSPTEVMAKVRSGVVRIETDLGSGSGFIVDPDGLILTNNHVIQDAREITVVMEDGTKLDGRVQGRDRIRDLAVVNIEATGLPKLEFGDLGQIEIGSDALAVGFPLGRSDLAITRGLVSSIVGDDGRNIFWIQTESAINPGNSGGPLLNLQGDVIGVITAKYVGAAIEGIGFAVSPNTVQLYLERIKSGEGFFAP